MSIRQWFRSQLLGPDQETQDSGPPVRAFVESLFSRGPERVHAMGEYTSETYPGEIRELVARRQDVTDELLSIDIGDKQARIEAIPKLQQLLRKYPHPLVYETLIHAYVDAGRVEEAKGVAFAARDRRREVEKSAHPEIRAEIESLREWTARDVEELT